MKRTFSISKNAISSKTVFDKKNSAALSARTTPKVTSKPSESECGFFARLWDTVKQVGSSGAVGLLVKTLIEGTSDKTKVTPTPKPDIIELRTVPPTATPVPVAITPKPTAPPTPTISPQDAFLDFLEEQAANRSIYVYGASGEYGGQISEKWIRNKEADYPEHVEQAVASYRERQSKGGEFRAFDCSGLGSCWLVENGYYDRRKNADMMMDDTERISRDQLQKGDWVFKVNESGRATHIGYVVDDALNVVESKGREYGVIKAPLEEGNWNAYGNPEAVFQGKP